MFLFVSGPLSPVTYWTPKIKLIPIGTQPLQISHRGALHQNWGLPKRFRIRPLYYSWPRTALILVLRSWFSVWDTSWLPWSPGCCISMLSALADVPGVGELGDVQICGYTKSPKKFPNPGIEKSIGIRDCELRSSVERRVFQRLFTYYLLD